MRTFAISELRKLCSRFSYEEVNSLTISGVAVDSRQVERGNLFFCLPGKKEDGHRFLSDASQKGAVAAVVHSGYQGSSFGMTLIHVDDVLLTLQSLASMMVGRGRQKIIGITGSVGKTTAKTLIYNLLKTKYLTVCTPQNYNSQIGLPLTILNHTTGEEDYFVLEMGMTELWHIRRLVEIAPPDIAVITKVALAHSRTVTSLEEIAIAKTGILSSCRCKDAVIDYEILRDYPLLLNPYDHMNMHSFSTEHTEADYYMDKGSNFLWVSHRDDMVNYGEYPLSGNHHKHNLLAAIVTAKLAGVSSQEIAEVIPTLVLPRRRMEICKKSGITFVDDSYNAAPAAMRAALENLPNPRSGGRKIAVLGEMLDLGEYSEACHKQIGEHALNFIDELYCFGSGCYPILEVWKQAGKPVHYAEERSGLIPQIKENVKENDVVLLKGSNSKEVWKIMDEFGETK